MDVKVENSKPKRVLHIIRSLKAGGIGAFIMNMYRRLDITKTQFDFAVTEEDEGVYGYEIKQRGGRIYYISQHGNNSAVDGLIQLRNLYKILKDNHIYTTVHSHYYFANAYFLLVAKICGVKCRVSHSHNTRANKIVSPYKRIFEKISLRVLEHTATHMLGCSDAATIFLYGIESFNKKKARTIYNGIDLEVWNKGKYDELALREKYGILEAVNFIFVGRFEEQKNPIFLINVFSNIKKRIGNAHLTLVGYGSLEDTIKKEIASCQLENAIKILPSNTNVPEIMVCMDYMLLPSLFEGLPITLLEAQAMKVRCFVSENISKEVDVGLCNFISINKGEEFWAEEIIKVLNSDITEFTPLNQDKIKCFNVEDTIANMLGIY